MSSVNAIGSNIQNMRGNPLGGLTIRAAVILGFGLMVALWLVINTLQTSPVESAVGLILLMLGLPFYFYYRRATGSAETRSGALIREKTS